MFPPPFGMPGLGGPPFGFGGIPSMPSPFAGYDLQGFPPFGQGLSRGTQSHPFQSSYQMLLNSQYSQASITTQQQQNPQLAIRQGTNIYASLGQPTTVTATAQPNSFGPGLIQRPQVQTQPQQRNAPLAPQPQIQPFNGQARPQAQQTQQAQQVQQVQQAQQAQKPAGPGQSNLQPASAQVQQLLHQLQQQYQQQLQVRTLKQSQSPPQIPQTQQPNVGPFVGRGSGPMERPFAQQQQGQQPQQLQQQQLPQQQQRPLSMWTQPQNLRLSGNYLTPTTHNEMQSPPVGQRQQGRVQALSQPVRLTQQTPPPPEQQLKFVQEQPVFSHHYGISMDQTGIHFPTTPNYPTIAENLTLSPSRTGAERDMSPFGTAAVQFTQQQQQQQQQQQEAAGLPSGEEVEWAEEHYSDGSHYRGFKRGDLRHGRGTLRYVNGGVYDGSWVDGKMEGFGRMLFASGNVAYEGWFREDKFDGEGILYNEEPEPCEEEFDYKDFGGLESKWTRYEGEFKNDNKEGHGKLFLSNGERFEGEFLDDRVHGRGSFYTLHGERVNGLWEDNKLISLENIEEAD